MTPVAIRMSLPECASLIGSSRRSRSSGRLSHRPDSRLATRRLAFREAFPVALDLFELNAMATGRGDDLVREWRTVEARRRAARGERAPIGAADPAAAKAPEERRPRG